MKLRVLWLWLVCLILSPLTVKAQMSLFGGMDAAPPSNGSGAKPLMWQKIEFEDKLTKSLRSNLSLILPEDQFLITVELRLKDEEKKKATSRSTASAPSVLGGNDLMSKLGVDEPMTSMSDLENKDNLFENISSFTVTMMVDEGVDPEREKTAEDLLKKLVPRLNDIRPRVKLERIALIDTKAASEAAAEEALKAEQKSAPLSILKDFKDPVGRVVALIIFGLIVFVVSFICVGKVIALGESAVNAYKDWVATQQQAGDAGGASIDISGSVGDSGEHIHVSEEAGIEDEAASRIISSSADKNLAGIDKFRELVTKDPKTAALFVRQWLKFMPLGATDALVVLTRFLHPDQLVQLFNLMSPKERKDLSKMLNAPLSRDALGRADLFLNNQLILDLIVPKPELAPDIQELIFAVTAEEVSAIYVENKEMAAQVMSLLPSSQISSIASRLDDDVCAELYPLLAKANVESSLKNIESIKQGILKLRGDGDMVENPFIESIPDLMPTASMNKEKLLYNVLVESKQWKMIKVLSEQSFPSSLISDLPVELIKAAFLKLSNPRRAELILSKDESEREVYFSAVGEPGKKLRDMLDLEI